MTTKWPTLTGSIRKTITIWHSQAWAGNPELHPHDVTITFGWKRQINPWFSRTYSLDEAQKKADKLCYLVADRNLNEFLPFNPTVETLACWLLVRAQGLLDWIEIEAYDGYKVRLERPDIPEKWRKVYLGEDLPQGLTA